MDDNSLDCQRKFQIAADQRAHSSVAQRHVRHKNRLVLTAILTEF